MRLFVAGVAAKLGAIARLFDPDELERLKKIGPEIVRRLERNDSDLILVACLLMGGCGSSGGDGLGECPTLVREEVDGSP